MCRLFGFRSVIKSQVHTSLVEAKNALIVQSGHHSDGWGVGYYVEQVPHIIRSVEAALEDKLFKHVSGVVASETVLAHLRKATNGEKLILNTHPFQHGRWVFAHNGNIKDFEQYRDALKSRIHPTLSRYILGETDSEIIFFLILTHMMKTISFHESRIEIDHLKKAVDHAVDEIVKLCGDYETLDGEPDKTYLTFIITNGSTMLAFQGGKTLKYSTHKDNCLERDSCSYFAQQCENPTLSGFVNHLVFSSESLKGQNIWNDINPGQMIGIDWRMNIKIY